MQSAVIEKGIKIGDYKFALIDVVVGAIATVVVAFFIIVACAATLNVNNVTITEAKDAAMALKPLAGSFASIVFAFGLFIASIFSATILPLATAFFVCEGFGFEAGIDKKIKRSSAVLSSFYFNNTHLNNNNSYTERAADRYNDRDSGIKRYSASCCLNMHDYSGQQS